MSKSVACTGHCSNGQDDRYGLPASTMLCPPCAEVDAIRAALAAAEVALADERRHAEELEAAVEECAGTLNNLLDWMPEPDPEKCSDVRPIHTPDGTEFSCEGNDCWQCLMEECRTAVNKTLFALPAARRGEEVANG